MTDRKPMDCGDSSCGYEGRKRGGMRTNGGCCCLKDLDFDKRLRAQGYIRYLEAEVERLRMWEEAGKEYLADRDEMRKTLERTVVDSMRLGALLERAELVIPPGPLSREIRAALAEEGKP